MIARNIGLRSNEMSAHHRVKSPLTISEMRTKETLSLTSCIGILLVSSAIVSLAFQNRNAHGALLPAAFTTGALIGAYTVVDGIGVRLSEGSVHPVDC
jgi:hypothetical protein